MPGLPRLNLAIAPAVATVKLLQDGLRKPGLQHQLLPQVITLVPHGPPPQVRALILHGLPHQAPAPVPHGLPIQILVLVPRTPSQVMALVAQAGEIKITTPAFSVCYNLKLLG